MEGFHALMALSLPGVSAVDERTCQLASHDCNMNSGSPGLQYGYNRKTTILPPKFLTHYFYRPAWDVAAIPSTGRTSSTTTPGPGSRL